MPGGSRPRAEDIVSRFGHGCTQFLLRPAVGQFDWGYRVPGHRSFVDRGIWEAPLVDGAPTSTWVIPATVSLAFGFAAAVLALVLDIVAPQVMNVWAGSPVAMVDSVCFVVGAVLTGFGFTALFRWANREIAAGYITLSCSSFRCRVPLVNARTRRIEGGAASRFDPAAARARALPD